MARNRKARARTRRRMAAKNSGLNSSGRHESRVLRCERLEDRRLLAVVTVDTPLDVIDFNDGKTSLREAIFATNTVGGADEIRFDFGHDGPATILLTQGELAITDALTITSPSAELLTIDASGNDPTPDEDNGDGSRVFRINDGDAATSIEVTIEKLHLRGGDVTQAPEAGEAAYGGAVFSFEPLTLVDVIVSDSTARHGGGVAVANASLTIRDSLIERNSAASAGGGVWISRLGRPPGESHSLVIEGSTLRANVVFRASGRGGGVYTEAALATVSNSTIAENSAPDGGGIAGAVVFSFGELKISDSAIEGNEATLGAGIHGAFRTIALHRTTVASNRADWMGGGVWHYSSAGSLEIVDSKIVGNRGEAYAGGVFAKVASLTVDRSEIRGNSTGTAAFAGRGGGLNIGPEESTGQRLFVGVVRDSIIADNSAIGTGGGVVLHGGDLTIERSTISGNRAMSANGQPGDGGGVLAIGSLAGPGTLTVTASSIVDNVGHGVSSRAPLQVSASTIARNEGTGILAMTSRSHRLTIESSTVSSNSAGGVAVSSGILSVRHSTIANNIRATATQVAAAGISLPSQGSVEISSSIVAGNRLAGGAASDLSSLRTFSTASIGSSLIGFFGGSEFTEVPVGSPDANGNLIGGPVHGVIDPLLGPLADNGGLTLTHALLPGSPAIGAGDPALVPGVSGVPEFDQRGAPFTRVAGARIDIGAFEAQAESGALNADFDFNGAVDGGDFLTWQRNLGKATGATIRHGDATADGDVDGNDLAVWAARFGEGSGFGVQGSAEELGDRKLDSLSEASMLRELAGVAQQMAFASTGAWASPAHDGELHARRTAFEPPRRIARPLAWTASVRDAAHSLDASGNSDDLSSLVDAGEQSFEDWDAALELD